MTLTLRRALLALLAFVGGYTGIWACAAPRQWYANFPGFGRHWLPPLGPYNQHLTVDMGAMFVALTAITLLALARARDDGTVRTTATAWLVFNVLHIVFHLTHLHMYGPLDKALNAAGLTAALIASLALLLPVPRTPGPARPETGTSPAAADRTG
ncbi:hypothetical protein ABZ883_21730 [Streptomyces sp. NPDC046977]|uniref:hypothetical protein n=1 Tax=Streptomyces sp. NPDC046977 TaxID=3154703 RepID=UPI0034049B61